MEKVKKFKDLICTIDEDDEVADLSEESDVEVEVSCDKTCSQSICFLTKELYNFHSVL